MITKQIAGLLYSFSYQLQDNEGNVYWIEGVENCPYDDAQLTLELMGHKLKRITNKEIGSTYKILARPIEELTKEIEHDGKKFMPIDLLNEENGTVAAYSHNYPIRSLPNWMVERLKEWQFNIDFPEGTTIDLI